MTVYYIKNLANEPTDNASITLDNDPSLGDMEESSLESSIKLSRGDFNGLFLGKYGIDYISDYFYQSRHEFRVVTHPVETKTCFQKADLLDAWDPLNVIKVFYFEIEDTESLYAVVIPETGCFIDKEHLKKLLGLPKEVCIKKSKMLPLNMTYGTCSPFIVEADLKKNGGMVEKIIFDTETLVLKKNESRLDDFSFGLDHQMSIQMSYYHCFKLLKNRYPETVSDQEVLSLSFKETFIRVRGRIKISYEFDSINYRTAQFINSIHGAGDVSIINDYIDELDLPDVLTLQK